MSGVIVRWRLLSENGGTRKAPSRARTQREPEEYREIPHAGPPSADAADSNAPRIPPSPPWMLGALELGSFKKSRQNLNFETPNPPKIELWRGLGGMFDEFGMSGAILVRPGRVWNASWLRFRASGEHFGGVLRPSWRVLRRSWRGFGESWRLLGSFLGVFYAILSNMRK